MKGKSFQIAVLASVIAMGVRVTSATIVTAESGETISEKQSVVPRYSETCVHGHNGFDCKPSAYRVDISDLQERVTALEKRISKP
jgi:hypothetical protein